MTKFTASMGIATKLLIGVAMIVTLFVAGVMALFVAEYRSDALASLEEKAAAFTAVADEAKVLAGEQIRSGAINMEKLISEAQAAMAQGRSYRDTAFFNTVPVVVGWTAAGAAAEAENIEFRIAAFEARNPDNEPERGSFEETLLRDLESQIASGGEASLARVNSATNSLHYMRAVGLDASCMSCHGDPQIHDPDRDGKDILGFAMEGWDEDDTHGAYEIVVPLAGLDDQVAAFVGGTLAYVIPAGLAVCGGFAFLLRNLLTKPVKHLVASMQDIATGDGDLTKRLALQRRDEIGQLGHWFDKFVESIQNVIRQISAAADGVAAAATQIAASNEQMSAGLTDQRSQADSASRAVTELNSSVSDIARQTAEAAATAEQSRKRATGGGEIVRGTVEEISAISTEISESAKAVGELNAKSEQIGGVIAVINDIADQTNLLALNAAIEAARAGEHGRGFAVVADEVRKLAERTTQATEEVSRSIREIQQQTTQAAARIEESTSRMTRGVELAGEAGVSLEEIVAGSGALLSQVQSIAAAAEEQAVSAAQISDNIERVTSVARESAEAANQASQAAASLSQQSEELRRLVKGFKA